MEDGEIDPGAAAYAKCEDECQAFANGLSACRDTCDFAHIARRRRRGPSGPNAPAGYSAMRGLMQRARDERDYGGAVDD